jgi:hypothetical protein
MDNIYLYLFLAFISGALVGQSNILRSNFKIYDKVRDIDRILETSSCPRIEYFLWPDGTCCESKWAEQELEND